MANYNASGLIALQQLAEEEKAKKEAEAKAKAKQDVCDNTEQEKECVRRMVEAWTDCD